MAETAGYEERIERLRRALEEAQALRREAEATLRVYRDEEERIVARLRELGVEPEGVDAELERLRGEIERLLREVEAEIPWDLLEEEGSGRGPARRPR